MRVDLKTLDDHSYCTLLKTVVSYERAAHLKSVKDLQVFANGICGGKQTHEKGWKPYSPHDYRSLFADRSDFMVALFSESYRRYFLLPG